MAACGVRTIDLFIASKMTPEAQHITFEGGTAGSSFLADAAQGLSGEDDIALKLIVPEAVCRTVRHP